MANNKFYSGPLGRSDEFADEYLEDNRSVIERLRGGGAFEEDQYDFEIGMPVVVDSPPASDRASSVADDYLRENEETIESLARPRQRDFEIGMPRVVSPQGQGRVDRITDDYLRQSEPALERFREAPDAQIEPYRVPSWMRDEALNTPAPTMQNTSGLEQMVRRIKPKQGAFDAREYYTQAVRTPASDARSQFDDAGIVYASNSPQDTASFAEDYMEDVDLSPISGERSASQDAAPPTEAPASSSDESEAQSQALQQIQSPASEPEAAPIAPEPPAEAVAEEVEESELDAPPADEPVIPDPPQYVDVDPAEFDPDAPTVEQVSMQDAEGEEVTDEMTPEEQEAAYQRRLRLAFGIGQGVRGLASLVGGFAGAGGAVESIGRDMQQARQGETQRVAARQQMLGQRAQRRQAAQQAQAERDQRREEFDQQQAIRERGADRDDRGADRSDRELELEEESSRITNMYNLARSQQVGRENETVPAEELSIWYDSLAAAGRTGNQTRDQFVSQNWTRAELTDNLNQLRADRRKKRGGGRRGGGGGGGGGGGAGSDASGLATAPEDYTEDQRDQYRRIQMSPNQYIAFHHFGWRPEGWEEVDGVKSEERNPDSIGQVIDMDTTERLAIRESLDRAQAQFDEAEQTSAPRSRAIGQLRRGGVEVAGRTVGDTRGANLYVPRDGGDLSGASRTALQSRISNYQNHVGTVAGLRQATARYNALLNPPEGSTLPPARSTLVNWQAAREGGTLNEMLRSIAQSSGSDAQRRVDAMAAQQLFRARTAYQNTMNQLREVGNWGALTDGERRYAETVVGRVDPSVGTMEAFNPAAIQQAMTVSNDITRQLQTANRNSFRISRNRFRIQNAGSLPAIFQRAQGRPLTLHQLQRLVRRAQEQDPSFEMPRNSISQVGR